MKIARDQRRVFIGEQFECSVSTAQGIIRFKAIAHSIGSKELSLRIPAKYSSSFSKGQDAEIIFVRPGKAFRFKTKIINSIKTPEHSLLILAGTSKVEQIERRSVERNPIRGALEFRSGNEKTLITYNGKVSNVSEDGLMFSTMLGGIFAPGSRPVGQEVQLNLTLLATKLPNLTGVVRHAFAHPELRGIVIVNLEFTGISAGMKGRISRVLRR